MSEEEARNCSNLGQWARHEEVGSSLGRESDVKVCKEEGKKEKSGSEFQKERPIPAVHQPDDEWQDSKKPEAMEDVGPVSIVKSEEEGGRTSSLVSTQDNRTPGAFHVGGGGDEVTSEDADFDAENPVTAELVDTDLEKQRVQEQVNIKLQRERAKAQIAEVVPERCCDRRRTLVGVIVLSLLTILGIILGVTITKDDGPPPTPVPPIEKVIETLSLVSSDGGEALQTPGSAQHDALSWLANDTFQGYYTDEKLIQRYSLATLFFSTNGKNWFNKSMWLDEGDECDRWWQPTGGILCDSLNGSITSLELGSNNLVGTIPAEIGLLKSLVSLGLSYNDFLSERIPTEIAELTSLKELNLKTCKLSGSVPEQLINVTTLNSLDLSENSLEGTFVADIDKLTNLETLSLYQNTFKSRLPNDISKLTNLKQLNLRSNELSGSIPSNIGNLSLLTEISLYENHFNGPLPSELGVLTSLARLNLHSCNLTGSIPAELMTLPLLFLLHLQGNSLTGTIPEISALSNLEEINLRQNHLSGSIPERISQLSLLTQIILYENELTSSIPELSKLTNLENLNLRHNKLSGPIPSGISFCTLLVELEVSENQLSSSLPSEIVLLSNLRVLSARENQMNGTIPADIGRMTALELLQLMQNQLTGTIPFLGSLTALTDLNIRDNKMTGDIPNEIYSLTALQSLNLGNEIARGNAFRGTLPSNFSFPNLEGLLLHKINISGTIPPAIGRLTNLLSLWLQGNALTGTVPPVIQDMEKLTKELFLYNNNLTGNFVCPTRIKKCLVSCDNYLDDACGAL